MKFVYTLLFTLLFHLGFSAQDSLITRGPYLQLGTDTSIVIQWRTDTAVQCIVRYGTQAVQLTLSVNESTATTEHSIRVGGLQPVTKYYYSISAGASLLAGDSTYNFITNPFAGTVQPVHIWVTGDMGRANQQQKDVRDAYWNNVKGSRHTDSWLWLGDNVYSEGRDSQYQDKLFNIYPEILRNTVARPCPGNHDYGAIDPVTHNGPYYENFTMPENGEAGGEPSGEEGYYSYDYGNVHFVSLNSEVLLWYLTANSQMCNWLKNDLQNTTQPWKIVYWHQPPFTKGSHDSDDAFSNMSFMRQNIVPILEQYGVDLVLTGHSHNYERSFLIHNHYGVSGTFNLNTHAVSPTSGKVSDGTPYTKYTTGPNANKGTVYIVCGNGGSITSGESLNHPAMYFSQQDSAGFMTIDVNGMQLDAKYYDSHGNMWDDFTIIKSAANPNGTESLESVIQQLNIFPNPSKDNFCLEIQLHEEQLLDIDFLDISGKNILGVYEGKVGAEKSTFNIATTDLPAGNYLIRLSSSKLGNLTRLVTLQR